MRKILMIIAFLPLVLESGSSYRLKGEKEKEDFIITYTSNDSSVIVKTHKSALKSTERKILPIERLEQIFK